ncbi:sulfatase [candidate division KSB1 bacterium]
MKDINRRHFLNSAIGGVLGVYGANYIACQKNSKQPKSQNSKPNIVIMYADNMGYGDWSRGGSPTIHTPNLNNMADEGVQMTQFYVSTPTCSPSRASLLTGRNPIRTGLIRVLFNNMTRGLPQSEITIAEALKPLGYKTACIGKWHLGCQKEHFPGKHGFDYFFGMLYSPDMIDPDIYRNEECIEHPSNLSTIHERIIKESIQFIESSKNKPFFLYLPFIIPHVPHHPGKKFKGKSRRGLYGDVIEEMDWGVGQINKTLDKLGLSKNTFVLFTSDNGPWSYLKHFQEGGSPGPMFGNLGDCWEGGVRVPCVARWPGRLPAGKINMEVGSIVDLFPTIMELAGGKIPDDRPYDGINIMPVLEGKNTPERTLFFEKNGTLSAVRKGKWKLHLTYAAYNRKGYGKKFINAKWITPEIPMLFNVEDDPLEQYDVSADYPGITAELTKLTDDYKTEIERNAENKDLLEWYYNDFEKELDKFWNRFKK